jgi:peptide methionine sulfoxide reductase MsrA
MEMGKMEKMFFGIGVFWAIMAFVWSAVTVVSLIAGKDHHHSAVMDLLCLILANQAFERARVRA